MGQQVVRCEQCGSQAVVIATEGELLFDRPERRSRVILIVECPKCGRREQPEESGQASKHN
jgi:hypothetical protein